MRFSKLYKEDEKTVSNSTHTGFDTSQAILWNDIAAKNKFNSIDNKLAMFWIKGCLGYSPEPFAYLPDIGFVLSLVNRLDQGSVTRKDFDADLVLHVTQIRNRDMEQGGWLTHTEFGQLQMDYYNTVLPQFKEAARERLRKFMGYASRIEHSFEAEVLLRNLFESEKQSNHIGYGEFDLKAATITRYEEIYLIHGEVAARNSEVVGIRYLDRKTSFEDQMRKRPAN